MTLDPVCQENHHCLVLGCHFPRAVNCLRQTANHGFHEYETENLPAKNKHLYGRRS